MEIDPSPNLKDELRANALARRDALSPAEREAAAARVLARHHHASIIP